jgi:hypothetical protein
VSGRCNGGPFVSCKKEIGFSFFETVEVFLKNRGPKGMDSLEPVGVNKDSSYPVSIVSKHGEHLVRRASVKISFQPEMQAFSASVKHDSEIAGHGSPPVSCSSIGWLFSACPIYGDRDKRSKLGKSCILHGNGK